MPYGSTGPRTLTIALSGWTVDGSPLTFTATAAATPNASIAVSSPYAAGCYIGTSGQQLFAFFVAGTAGTGSAEIPSVINQAPLIYHSGTLVGQCTNPLVVPGTFPYVSFNLPSGVVVSEGATGYSISTQPSWVTMQSGDVCNGITEQAITNYAGQSCFGTGKLTKTFKPGMNFSYIGPIDACTYNVAKNWRLRMGTPYLANGPLYVGYPFLNLSWSNGVDSTNYPGIPGYWAIGFDDTESPAPATVQIISQNTSICTVNWIHGNDNAGTGGGQNQYYLFEVAYASGTTSVNTPLSIQIYNGQATPSISQLSNLWILGPGDFIVPAANDTTWSFDRTSSPCALSNQFLSNFVNSVGSCRWVDATLGFANYCAMTEPWEGPQLNALSWNNGWYPSYTITYTEARALVPPGTSGSTSYIYSEFLGSLGLSGWATWTCSSTLGANITSATQTTITFSSSSSAANDPVFCGVLIQIDSEKMQVQAASGASITVFRGACGTTATTHSSGTAITILSKRWAWTSLSQFYGETGGVFTNRNQIVELVCASPHGLTEYASIPLGSTWPTLNCVDGSQINLNTWNVFNNVNGPLITGPNTFAVYAGRQSGVATTLSASSSAVSISVTWSPSGGNGFPMEFIAMATGTLLGADLHVNIPLMATDAYVWDVAAKILANFPAGRRVYVELSDEPWNYWNSGAYYTATPMSLNAGVNYFYYMIVIRTGQIRTIFRTVFGSRENEIHAVLNMQEGTTQAWTVPTSSNLGTALGVAAYYNVPIDALRGGQLYQSRQ